MKKIECTNLLLENASELTGNHPEIWRAFFLREI